MAAAEETVGKVVELPVKAASPSAVEEKATIGTV